jgi:hypothetical protein
VSLKFMEIPPYVSNPQSGDSLTRVTLVRTSEPSRAKAPALAGHNLVIVLGTRTSTSRLVGLWQGPWDRRRPDPFAVSP